MNTTTQTPEGTKSTFINQWKPNSDESSIKFRLDPDPMLRKIQVYLLGVMERVVEDSETGELKRELFKVGTPKVNDDGLQAVMFQVESVVNAMTVQGNLKDDQYIDFLADFHMALADDLFVNSQKYGIAEDDYNGIIAGVFNMVRLQISRTIANKEREALGQSTQSNETVISRQNNGGGWKRFIPGI